jgi:pimeloyl-ACP methyl ester carboxylesterase
MTQKVYIISGLGVDERVFQNIDLAPFTIVHIKWIEPSHDDTIESYGTKLIQQIDDKNPTIIGLSFGGMVAVEIAKQMEVSKLILISSAKSMHEIPFYYRWPAKIGLHELIPTRLLKKANFISYYMFGIRSYENKILFEKILQSTDTKLLSWAINQIVHWSNENLPRHAIHIHGHKDRLLPSRFIQSHHSIEHGGHFMIMENAAEINKLLMQILHHK